VFSNREFDRDYGSFRTALVVVGMLLIGGSRLSHLCVLDRDPLFLRFVRLPPLPDERTFSRGLLDMIASHQDGMNELLRDVTYRECEEVSFARVTIELDGTVLSTGECVDGAERGFNPYHSKVPSYYPLTTQLAQTGQILGAWNRPGNVNDSLGAADRLTALIADVRGRLTRTDIRPSCTSGNVPRFIACS